jgi:TrmH family RNA methyltransferase
MKPGTVLSSTSNPKIKFLLSLEKPRERRKQQLFVIEGHKEIMLALKASYKIGNIFYCIDQLKESDLDPELVKDKLVIPVTQEVFDKIAIRENSGGVVAVAEMKTHNLSDIKTNGTPLFLVLESVEKPGNLGAILRTADAAGVTGVIICDPQTDIYNPNVIRSSIGCLFTQPIAIASSAETIAWLQKHGFAIWCTYLPASKPYYEVDYTKAGAIVMGTEATGLSPEWIKSASSNIVIPMAGEADSMNVSTSAAVVVFEARRQRGFK